MSFKSPTQPRCRCCGKLIAKATQDIYFHQGEPTGSRPVANTTYLPQLPRNKAEAQTHTNLQVTSVSRYTPSDHHPDGGVYRAGTWDGESYVDGLFCRLACAASFGRMAATHYPNLHTQLYADVIKETA